MAFQPASTIYPTDEDALQLARLLIEHDLYIRLPDGWVHVIRIEISNYNEREHRGNIVFILEIGEEEIPFDGEEILRDNLPIRLEQPLTDELKNQLQPPVL